MSSYTVAKKKSKKNIERTKRSMREEQAVANVKALIDRSVDLIENLIDPEFEYYRVPELDTEYDGWGGIYYGFVIGYSSRSAIVLAPGHMDVKDNDLLRYYMDGSSWMLSYGARILVDKLLEFKHEKEGAEKLLELTRENRKQKKEILKLQQELLKKT
jgi:hypothetical protein